MDCSYVSNQSPTHNRATTVSAAIDMPIHNNTRDKNSFFITYNIIVCLIINVYYLRRKYNHLKKTQKKSNIFIILIIYVAVNTIFFSKSVYKCKHTNNHTLRE